MRQIITTALVDVADQVRSCGAAAAVAATAPCVDAERVVAVRDDHPVVVDGHVAAVATRRSATGYALLAPPAPVPHALLLEIFTDAGIHTQIVPDGADGVGQ